MSNRVVVDVGNSRITGAVFVDGEIVETLHFLVSNPQAAAHGLTTAARGIRSNQMALCSVVPSVTEQLTAKFQESALDVLHITQKSQTVITHTYDTMGGDRIANMAAAAVRAVNKPSIVIDFGSATTLTAVSEKREFLGGFITLGIGKTLKALSLATAQLPEIENLPDERRFDLAFDTKSAIAIGTVSGHAGLVERWLYIAEQEIGHDCFTIATGGFAQAMVKHLNCFDLVEPNLTLYGINLIAEAATDPADPS